MSDIPRQGAMRRWCAAKLDFLAQVVFPTLTLGTSRAADSRLDGDSISNRQALYEWPHGQYDTGGFVSHDKGVGDTKVTNSTGAEEVQLTSA
jgi:hypothetical protein